MKIILWPVLESSKCYTAQKQFDDQRQAGLIGHLMQRPECDGDGNFQPVRCIPGQTWVMECLVFLGKLLMSCCLSFSCYCVDEEGKRIFGEAVHTASIQISMRCGKNLKNYHSKISSKDIVIHWIHYLQLPRMLPTGGKGTHAAQLAISRTDVTLWLERIVRSAAVRRRYVCLRGHAHRSSNFWPSQRYPRSFRATVLYVAIIDLPFLINCIHY